MKYTINNITPKTFEDKQTKKQTILNGFTFIDELGHCIIIVYGEGRRDLFIEYLKT